MGNNYDRVNLYFVDDYNYCNGFESKESTHTARKSDKEEYDMPQLEGDKKEYEILPLKGDDKEVGEGKEVKILTPSKLLTRLPIL